MNEHLDQFLTLGPVALGHLKVFIRFTTITGFPNCLDPSVLSSTILRFVIKSQSVESEGRIVIRVHHSGPLFQTLSNKSSTQVIFLEEDLEVSPDFFSCAGSMGLAQGELNP